MVPSKLDHEAQQRAVDTMEQTGSMSLAAASAGVHRTSLWRLRQVDAEFDERVRDARARFVAVLEAEAFRRAVVGVEEERVGAGGAKYRVRKFSDAILLHLLKANDPEKHGDKRTVDQRVQVEARVDQRIESLQVQRELGKLTDDQCRDLLALMREVGNQDYDQLSGEQQRRFDSLMERPQIEVVEPEPVSAADE